MHDGPPPRFAVNKVNKEGSRGAGTWILSRGKDQLTWFLFVFFCLYLQATSVHCFKHRNNTSELDTDPLGSVQYLLCTFEKKKPLCRGFFFFNVYLRHRNDTRSNVPLPLQFHRQTRVTGQIHDHDIAIIAAAAAVPCDSPYPGDSSGWLASCRAHLSTRRVLRFPGVPGNRNAFRARVSTAAGQSVKVPALHRGWKAERSSAISGESRWTVFPFIHVLSLLLHLLLLSPPSLPRLTAKQLYISWCLSSTHLPPHRPRSRHPCRDFRDLIHTTLPNNGFLSSFIACELTWGLNVRWGNSMRLNHGCFAGSTKQWKAAGGLFYIMDHQSGACLASKGRWPPLCRFTCVSPRPWIDVIVCQKPIHFVYPCDFQGFIWWSVL